MDNTTLTNTTGATRQWYELRTYTATKASQVSVLTDYFAKALIPALNRLEIPQVGVFEEYGQSDPPKIYLLIPFRSFQHYGGYAKALGSDTAYQNNGADFHQIPESQKVYFRYTSELMEAFESIPTLRLPVTQERIFELRTYEGYNDDAVRRKVRMFDKDELDLFYKKKLHPVFFGKVVAGYNLPKLTYLLTFKDMEEREQNWNNFFVDNPVWDRISQAPAYANTVSKVIKTFLKPLSISQI